MKNKIIILQRILPHYRTGIFRKLRERFPGLKVFYGDPCKNDSLRNADVTDKDLFCYCKNIYFGSTGKIFLSKIFSNLKRIKPDVIISVFNVGNLNLYILFFIRRLLGFKIILWSFGYDPVSGFHPDKKFTDKIRLYLSKKADAVIFYWEEGRKEVSGFSKNTSHFFVAPNTLDTDKMITLKDSFDKTGKDKIKSELGVSEKYHFVYIGRLLVDKQADLLLKAFSLVEKNNTDCRLTIIGDGPEKNKLQKLSDELKLKKISFAGGIHDEVLTGKWIYISDAFIMPGRLGLSVVHSFCFGTPVISQKKDSYYHGEGIGYMKNGINGFLTEDGNINDLSAKMKMVLNDPGLAEQLKLNAFSTSQNECSIGNMLEGFEKALEYVNNGSK